MVDSRDPAELLPTVRRMLAQFLDECRVRGLDIIVTSTFRDQEAQAELYARGRTKPGRIVTNAAPGWSWHNWRCAFDVVPLRRGKPVWGTAGNGIDDDPTDDDADDLEIWERVGQVGEFVGLEWAGRWTRFREFPHFQHTFGRTIQDVNRGIGLPETVDGAIVDFNVAPGRWESFVENWVPPRIVRALRNGRGSP